MGINKIVFKLRSIKIKENYKERIKISLVMHINFGWR